MELILFFGLCAIVAAISDEGVKTREHSEWVARGCYSDTHDYWLTEKPIVAPGAPVAKAIPRIHPRLKYPLIACGAAFWVLVLIVLQ